MCGIVGIIGTDNASEFLIDGLKRLEYRGYDSAGIAMINGKLHIKKEKGKIACLETLVNENPIMAEIGIGHTRWATHGVPSQNNAHPHIDSKSKFAVTHNGIIENYIELKEMLYPKGVTFYSETDTEVIPKLIEQFYNGDLLAAVKETIKLLKGSFALLVVSDYEPDKIIAVKKESPMIIGLGNKTNYAASDITALIDKTRRVIIMEDEQIAVIKKDSIEISDFSGNTVDIKTTDIDWDIGTAEKEGFDHFMIKEIYEQPQVIKNALKKCASDGASMLIKGLDIPHDYIMSLEKIHIVACGTAYNAGLVARPIIEKFTGIPVEVELASEFRYREHLINQKTLAVFVSQSGETADTLAALKMAKDKGLKTLTATNVVGSSITREADYIAYIHAGTEISVASTKAYTGQIVTLILMAAHFTEIKSGNGSECLKRLYADLNHLPDNIAEILKRAKEIKEFAEKIKDSDNAFYIGRGLDYAAVIEGVLKLKEISYIHAESFAAGELKHGPIALIEPNTPVIALCTQKHLLDKNISNIREVKARGAKIIGFGLNEFKELEEVCDYTFLFDIDNELLAPITSAVALQLLAYYTALARGCDIDQPRNLAKSVTVE